MRLQSDDLQLNSFGDEGKAILRKLFVEGADLGRGDLHALRDLRLHHLDNSFIASLYCTLLADLRELFIEVLLKLFLRAQLRDHILYPHVDHASDLRVVSLDTIDLRLVEEELLYRYLLRDDAVRISLESESLTPCKELLILNIREEDRFVTNHPYDLIHDGLLLRFVSLGLCKTQRAESHEAQEYYGCLSFHQGNGSV